jgi:predicted transcriptional regulator
VAIGCFAGTVAPAPAVEKPELRRSAVENRRQHEADRIYRLVALADCLISSAGLRLHALSGRGRVRCEVPHRRLSKSFRSAYSAREEEAFMPDNNELITLTADIVSAHVSHNNVAVGDVANLVQRVHEALSGLGAAPAEAQPQKKEPVVSIRASVKPDFIVCMECGKKQKTLKRHLQTAHGLSPGQYRQDYGLPDTYPMTAPNYSQQRQEMARRIGLGRKPAGSAPAAAAASEGKPQPKRRTRKEPAAS